MTARANRRRTLAFAALLTLCIGCDQAAKGVATSALGDGVTLSLLGDTLRLELVHNSGAFLGFGSGLPVDLRGLLFVLVVPLGIALVGLHVLRSGPLGTASLVGLVLLAGGGLGNWLDRLLHDGLVTDFVSIGLGPLRTGIFNLADVCIMGGIALFLLASGSEHQAE